MSLFLIQAWLTYLSKAETTLGATCSLTLCQSNQTGSSPPPARPFLFLLLLFNLYQGLCLITYLLSSTLVAVFPNLTFLDLKKFWLDHPGFFDTIKLHWNSSSHYANAVRNLSSKLKQVREGLKVWSKNLSKLRKLIYNCNWVLMLLDGLEDQRPLSRLETFSISFGIKENILEAKKFSQMG